MEEGDDWMNFLLAIVCIGIGIWTLLDTDAALRHEDNYRRKGEREYSDTATGLMKMRGIIALICGIAFLFIRF